MTQAHIVESVDVPRWAAEVDVIVAGFGMAGACATIEARERRAEVLVLEASARGGGTSVLAAGHFYLGGGTPVQQACGFDDSAGEMAAYLEAVSVDPDRERIQLYAEASVEHFAWLERHGVPFERSYYPHKAVAQPGPECLIWTGNEKVAPFRDAARPAPRGHKVAATEPETGGARAMQELTERVCELGVSVHYGCRVDALVVDGDRVVGVRYADDREPQYARAAGGVVLATGGFGQNETMLRRFVPDALSDGVVRIAAAHDIGDGIQLGIAAGAATDHISGAFVSVYWYPPEQLLCGVIVNSDGQRFVAEDSYHARTAAHILAQRDRRAWLIVDAEAFGKPQYGEALGIQMIGRSETIGELEPVLGLPPGTLERTLADYSNAAQTGHDPLGKSTDWLRPIGRGPYSAFDLSFGTAGYRAFTLGGLAVSRDGEVLTERGDPIEGLFAAGANATQIAQAGVSYASGLGLGTASYFGRRAGARAARRAVPSATRPHTG